MENETREQAILNVLAANMGQRVAQLEAEKAILMVDNQVLKDQLAELEKREKDDA